LQSGGGDECPSLGHLAGHGRERERDILVEVGGIVWSRIFRKRLEFRKMEKLVVVGKERNKGKGKRKRNWKREDILLEVKVKIMEVADSRV